MKLGIGRYYMKILVEHFDVLLSPAERNGSKYFTILFCDF